MPDIVHIRILGDTPGQHNDLELALVDKFLEEGGPLHDADLDVDTDVLQALLNDLGRQQTLLVALIGQDRESERLAVLDQNTVGVLFPPARLGQQFGRMFRIVANILHIRIVGPATGNDRSDSLLPHAEQHAVDQFILVDSDGHGLTDAFVAKQRMAQIVAHVEVTG